MPMTLAETAPTGRGWWLLLTLAAVLGLSSPCAAQDSPWNLEADAGAQAQPAPAAVLPKPAPAAAPTAAAPAPKPIPGHARSAAKAAPAPTIGAAHAVLPSIDGPLRGVLFGLVFLLAYLLPGLLFPALLRRERLRPGQSAAVCLSIGAGAVAFPGTLMLAATERFAAGRPVPWWSQSEHYGLALGGAGLLLVLAAIGWLSRPPQSEAW